MYRNFYKKGLSLNTKDDDEDPDEVPEEITPPPTGG